MNFKGENFSLKGEYLLEYSIFKIDIYIISYFQGEAPGTSMITLNYQRDLEKHISEKGWVEGFKNNVPDEKGYQIAMDWLIKNTPSVKEGDILYILKKDKVVSIYKNKKFLAGIEDPKIAEIVFLPWIGPKPVIKELKDALLGIK